MAKKTSSSKKESPRNLLKIIPSLGTTLSGTTWGDSEYKQIDVGLPNFPCFVWNGYWDMSGFTVQDKTWISLGAGIQDPGLYTLTPLAPAPVASDLGMVSLELMTTTPLDLQIVADDLASNRMPSFLSTTANWEQVIFAQWRGWTATNTTSFPDLLTPFSGQEFGSGEPSAAEKIYLYRFLLPTGTPNPTATFRVPGLRFRLGGVPVAEPDLEWIYRLRRSYVTQGELK